MPAWVTLTFFPPTVTVVDRDTPVPLAATVYATVPAPEPVAGATVTQLSIDSVFQAHPG
jgi:hypothetical protein